MNRSMGVRLSRIAGTLPAPPDTSPPGPSGFDAVAGFVAEHGGQLGHESMAAALARLIGVEPKDMRAELIERIERR